jgi:hypothetical protein
MKNLPKTLLAQVCGGRAEVVSGQISGGAAGHPSQIEVMATGAGLGGGYGAHVAIEAAGGLAELGVGAIAAGTAAVGGVIAAGYAGYAVGTLINDSNFLYIADGASALFDYAGSLSQAASNYYEGIGATSCTYAPGMTMLDMPDYSYQ